MSNTLHIEKQYGDRNYDTYLIEGLSVKEMDKILNTGSFNDQRQVLVDILSEHDNDSRFGRSIGECWICGYGIYGIRHFGGHLIVTVGNSCD